MNAPDKTEQDEFLRTAARAIGQRQMMLAQLDLPRDINDLDLQTRLGAWHAADAKLRTAARELIATAQPLSQTAGLTHAISKASLWALANALKLADSARKTETETFASGASPRA